MKLNIKSKEEAPEKETKKVAAKPESKPEPKKAEKNPEPKISVAQEIKDKVSEEIADKKTKRKEGEYSAKDIYVLKGLEPVRMSPGMYIGSTGVDGLHHLIWEVVDNCLDEAMAGYAHNIEVVLMPNNRVRVSDDGRGIPVEKHPDTGKSTLETVLTTLHAGGKFGGEAYKVSGGLHGVGISVVCALSDGCSLKSTEMVEFGARNMKRVCRQVQLRKSAQPQTPAQSKLLSMTPRFSRVT